MTIAADLHAGRIVGLGALPPDNTSKDSVISAGHAAKYKYCNVKVSVSNGGRLTCAYANSVDINGSYLFFEDNWSTLTRMDGIRSIVVSNNFSGCAFKVYKGGGAFFAAHIARPGGASSDANVTLLDDYARQHGWQMVQNVPSAGIVAAHAAAKTVAMVSQLVGSRVQTVRLALDNMGAAVSTSFYDTPV